MPSVKNYFQQANSGSDNILVLNGTVKANGNILNQMPVQLEVTDISTGDDYFAVSPISGKVVALYSAIDGAITGSDCSISLTIGNNVSATGTLVIPVTGSGAGIVNSVEFTENNDISINDQIKITSDGASTGTVRANLIILVRATV